MDRIELTPAGGSPRRGLGVDGPMDVAPPARAPDSGVTALRAALQTHLQARLLGSSPDGQLRRTIRLVCEDAQRQHLQVEHVIVVAKQAWHSLPEVRQLASSSIAAELLSAVVSLTIDEFYAARG